MVTMTLKCDHCETEMVDDDPEGTGSYEQGWLSVLKFDTLREELRDYDFCSTECLRNHFT